MKYTKIIKSVVIGGLLCFVMPSCTEWLSVKPADKTLEKDMFATEANIEIALNGIYLSMANTDTYGRNMTSYTVELLAQRYNIAGINATATYPTRWNITQYKYTDKKVKEHFAALWLQAYNIILNINLFIKNVEAAGTGILPQAHKDIMLGEAYALRAFVHLDMLRLFGPVYSKNPTANSIPYYTKPNVEWQPIEPAADIMVKIQDDVDRAVGLLANDPVRTKGVMVGDEFADDFYAYRNRRMNYYAAQALKVRALMYAGDKQAAASLAKELLDPNEIPAKFPWVISDAVVAPLDADRIFSSEVLFGITNKKLYKDYDEYFSPGIPSVNAIMATSRYNISFIFDNDIDASTDYRKHSWTAYRDANYYAPIKFAQSERENHFWFFQPLIRKAELYYVIAEVDNTTEYLDLVRAQRGLKPLAAGAAVGTEIIKEYMRETYGEGQLFFHYKRLNATTIRDMNQGTNLTMTDSKYIVPLPDREKNR